MTRTPMLLALLVISILLAVLELMFQSLYIGPVPVPAGTLMILLTMPWLVRATVAELPSAGGAAAPILVWFLTTAVVGAFGPGGDMLLPLSWQTLLLLFTGVAVGMVCFRRAVDRLAGEAAGARPGAGTGPATTTRKARP
ncbi:hypothetical protein [Pseudonocardia sp. KRD291]|uniref:hypothetical protein n=1 Tax=Pseudonocardia sp. KRD291 TaxID=2792007 RepID=UPI001C49FC02|nr:hypothetical protein [Pseudonocardia sp. KRD291]MBW0106622.1 hypothetical protein [Pseudonocardia sp. KRD291]